MTAFVAALPGRILAFSADHPIVWVAVGLIGFGCMVLGATHIHFHRQARRDQQRSADRYSYQEIR